MLDVDEVAPSVFTRGEQGELMRYAGAARRDAFLRGWARKEAYLKARSVGLSLPLADFEVSLDERDDGGLRSEVDPDEAARFTVLGLPAPAVAPPRSLTPVPARAPTRAIESSYACGSPRCPVRPR